jgi:hypothetical protein
MNIAAGTGFVYVVGAENSSAQAVTTVYYAQVSNGQITAWNTTTPVPAFTFGAYSTVINNQLWLFDGNGQVHYAPINTNGSLGAWINGPTGNVTVAQTGLTAFGNSGFMNTEGEPFTALSTGPALDFSYEGGSAFTSYPVLGNCLSQAGQWMTLTANYTNQYAYGTAYLQPAISVPLPATGLTNGATYHVLLQQQGGTSNDYLRLTTDVDVFTGNPTALTSPRLEYAWTALSSGTAVPIEIFDQTVVGNKPVHTWEDGGLRVSTLVYATTPDQRLLGLAEATQLAYASNENQGFETGISPWTVDSGTVVQSTTQVQEGVYSALVTASGSVSRVHLLSEMMPCLPGQSVAASCWAWCATAESNGFGVFINWYTVSGGIISTSGAYSALGASTWTQFTESATAPATAYLWQISISLQSTIPIPAFYVDNAYGYVTTGGPQVSSVALVEYPGTWPGGTYPPQGLVELA